MKFFRWNKHYLGWGLTAFIVIVASLLVFTMLANLDKISAGIGQFFSAIIPIFYGFIIAYLLAPVVRFFEERAFAKLFVKYDPPEIAAKKRKPAKKRDPDDPDADTKIYERRQKPEALSEEEKRYEHLTHFVKNKPRRILSITVTFLIFLGVIVGIIVAVAPQLIATLRTLINNIPEYMTNLTEWAQEMFTNYPDIGAKVTEMINDAGSTLLNFLSTSILPQMNGYLEFLTNGIMSLVGFVLNLIFGMVVAIYCLYSKELFAAQAKKAVYCVLSVKHANKLISSVRRLHRSFGNFITGTIIDSFVVGCMTFIVTTIAGVPFALLVSIIMGLTNIIPYFGPFIGIVPCLFLIFMEKPVMCIVFTIIVLIIQNLNGNVLSPKILGESTGLTSFWVIFAILAGQGIFGFWGLIIGIPLFAVIYSAVKGLIADRLEAKGLPPGSDEYTDIVSFDENDLVPVSLSQTIAAERAEKERTDEEARRRRREDARRKKEELKNRLDDVKSKINKGS